MTYTAVLDVTQDTVFFPARPLSLRRREPGTRRTRRPLGCYRQTVLVIRRVLDGTRTARLAADNGIGGSSAYRYVHEGIDMPAACAPETAEAIAAAKAAGHGHLNLDATVAATDRCCHPGPNGAHPWRSGKHKHHGANVQALSDPTGRPIRVCDVRSGREHDVTCAKGAAGLMPALEQTAAEGVPTLTDPGYEALAGPSLRMPVKKAKGTEPSEAHTQYNLIVRGVHGVADRLAPAVAGRSAVRWQVAGGPAVLARTHEFRRPDAQSPGAVAAGCSGGGPGAGGSSRPDARSRRRGGWVGGPQSRRTPASRPQACRRRARE